MTLTIDKLFSISLGDFMSIEGNYEKYKDYIHQNISAVHDISRYAPDTYILRSLPAEAELIVNFSITPLFQDNSSPSNKMYVSGMALIPKLNDGGSNVNAR